MGNAASPGKRHVSLYFVLNRQANRLESIEYGCATRAGERLSHRDGRRPKRDEDSESERDASAVERLQRLRNEAGRQACAHSWPEAAPRGEVSRVARLQLGDGENPVRVDREVVTRLLRQLESAEPSVALVEREIRLGEEGVGALGRRLLIESPSECRGPDAAGAGRLMVGR